MSEEHPHQAPFEAHVPREISGWLLVLCLALPIVYPGSLLYQLFANIIPRFGTAENPNRILLLGVYCVLFSALALFSFAAGLKLWLVRPCRHLRAPFFADVPRREHRLFLLLDASVPS